MKIQTGGNFGCSLISQGVAPMDGFVCLILHRFYIRSSSWHQTFIIRAALDYTSLWPPEARFGSPHEFIWVLSEKKTHLDSFILAGTSDLLVLVFATSDEWNFKKTRRWVKKNPKMVGQQILHYFLCLFRFFPHLKCCVNYHRHNFFYLCALSSFSAQMCVIQKSLKTSRMIM